MGYRVAEPRVYGACGAYRYRPYAHAYARRYGHQSYYRRY